ncbi:MAG: SGNH/GDSL hydrolase family protein [Hamadaea sp.]|nr:SGNH/GDSL hydrolase family protein [Hamadaea sp.]NUR47429.1 SGNH/GDSL hydrolase family protein [Hamadaea sp.]NUT03408.1 SGNH/GDSL hydrolase family protein [Hamadaea sp.]
MTELLRPGQHIVFIGDSITDCGRRDLRPPYGDGYLSLVRAFSIARRPELGLRWTNRGIAGNTVRDLAARWDEDVVALRPDWLSVMIGINDIWRSFTGQPDEAVPLDEYEQTLRSLLRRAVDVTGCRLVLADPYLIESDRDDPQRVQTIRYGEVVAALAAEFDAVHVRTQAAFDRVLETSAPSDWSRDRVHPNLPGHALIAETFLTALGLSATGVRPAE